MFVFLSQLLEEGLVLLDLLVSFFLIDDIHFSLLLLFLYFLKSCFMILQFFLSQLVTEFLVSLELQLRLFGILVHSLLAALFFSFLPQLLLFVELFDKFERIIDFLGFSSRVHF